MTLFTIGHSTRSLDQFLALLEREQIRQLADVRRFPTSRRHPHFDRDALAASLGARGIAYAHHPLLGGRRTPRPDSVNTGWRNISFRGYADYMASPQFLHALQALAELGALAPTAIMCAEAVPWRCHRTLIADALVAGGATVAHIMDRDTQPHVLTPFATPLDGRVTYPAPPEEDARPPRSRAAS